MNKYKKEIQQLTKAKKDVEKKWIAEVSFFFFLYILYNNTFTSRKSMKMKSQFGNKEKQISIIK